MTRFERERIAAEIERQNREADAGADAFLEKLKNSKWTAAILLGLAIGVPVIVSLFF